MIINKPFLIEKYKMFTSSAPPLIYIVNDQLAQKFCCIRSGNSLFISADSRMDVGTFKPGFIRLVERITLPIA